MVFRKDITDYLISQYGDNYKHNDYKVYEQDAILYHAEYNYDTNVITNYVEYKSIMWNKGTADIMTDISNKFLVLFNTDNSYIVCKCGETDRFSAYKGSYELRLKCNRCGNDFSAYSG